MGTTHGGVLCDIADAAIGTAHFTTLKEGESFTTINLEINFFRPFGTRGSKQLPDLFIEEEP
jgi:acyl-coenzyme A thioesterase PaaI-like protein